MLLELLLEAGSGLTAKNDGIPPRWYRGWRRMAFDSTISAIFRDIITQLLLLLTLLLILFIRWESVKDFYILKTRCFFISFGTLLLLL